jgi:alpha-L-arabinofuranosidase
MKNIVFGFIVIVCTAMFFSAQTTRAADATLTVDVNRTGPAISPMMHGIFFEDINYAADGGLYAELVQNRSFEHRDPLFAWSKVERGGGEVKISVETDRPLNANNPHYLRLAVDLAGTGAGVANDGWDGIAVKQGEKYVFTVHARGGLATKDTGAELTAQLESADGKPLGFCEIEGLTADWRKFTGTITATASDTHAKLAILVRAHGSVDFDMVSLFPENTFKHRANGLRADLAQMLADMHPGFMRFPGGCIVEGKDLPNAYRWKETIGDVAERKQNWNRWQDAVKDKAPQYYQTYGLGFFEFFQLCEDIGAEPVPILNCGMSCQFQDKQLVPLDQLEPFVQDSLDLIEFANGPATSKWGAKRAAMGHPAPFNLKYVGVGNEQWGDQYFERYPIFYKAIKARYPNIKIVTGSGPGVDDKLWKSAWEKFKKGTPADIVDEHYYRPPDWFYKNAARYDGYDRRGPKVFAGEYAAQTKGKRNNLEAALAEAAMMTGFERNADVVFMSSYAPLFAKENNTQWTPDAIWFDNTRAYGTPTYYVQSLFANHRGDVVLPSKLEQAAGVYSVATRDKATGEVILKIVNAAAQPVSLAINLSGARIVASKAEAIVLTSADIKDENTFDAPQKVAPREEAITNAAVNFRRDFPANSVSVLRISAK